MLFSTAFQQYYRDHFFSGNEEEFQTFLLWLQKPIKRTLRIKPGEIEGVKKRLGDDGWILTASNIQNVFFIDRTDDFNPLERRIGYTFDHLVGNFYIQELAAATAVSVMTNGKISLEKLLILDMASSPGGKTTQLSEMFPESFIIANEPSRERIPQLLHNLDRMGSGNIGVTLYPGQYFIKQPNFFDRVLLDAPCSGEGTLYKGTEATKYWNQKNILAIASLQKKLIRSGFATLKYGGEMLYSTCSMNHWENEEVVESLQKFYPGEVEILFQKRFMPHIDHTGGFFITKIRKKFLSTHTIHRVNIGGKKKLLPFRGKILPWKLKKGYTLYHYEGKVLAINESMPKVCLQTFFFMKLGDQVGMMKNGKFTPSVKGYKYLTKENLPLYNFRDDGILDSYLRGQSMTVKGEDGDILLTYNDVPIALETRKGNKISNRYPREWIRK